MLVVATFCWLYRQEHHQLPMLWPTVCPRLIQGTYPYSTTFKGILLEGKRWINPISGTQYVRQVRAEGILYGAASLKSW